MNKFRIILRNCLVTLFCLFIGFCIVQWVKNDFNIDIIETDCGTIVSKSNDEITIKHGTKTELYLNIQFDKKGFKSMEVEPTTYFKYQVGEHICFDLIKKDGFIATGVVSGTTIVIVGTVLFIFWLFGYKFN